MKLSFRASLFASALALSAAPLIWAPAPAAAQQDGGDVSSDSFHDALAPYGDWVYSDRWGEVWEPENVPDDFHPYYTNGRWVDTEEYGWTWSSDYEWGDIPFHYGRWVNDPDDGWMWIPGYVWSPGWVVWRSNDRYTGWMPTPPDDAFLGRGDSGGVNVTIDFNNTSDYYGYSRWYGRGYDENRFAANWTFVGTGNLSDRDYRAHAVGRPQIVNVIHSTTNITNYTVVNNYIVNRSVTANAVVRAGGHPVTPVAARTVFRRPELIATVETGRATQVHIRQVRPRGTGMANSAPQPSAAIVKSLSPHAAPHNGHPPAHVFTRETIVHAPLKPAAATAVTPTVTPAVTPTVTPGIHAHEPHTGTVEPTTGPGTGETIPGAHGHHEKPPITGGADVAPVHGHALTPATTPTVHPETTEGGTLPVEPRHTRHVVPGDTVPTEGGATVPTRHVGHVAEPATATPEPTIEKPLVTPHAHMRAVGGASHLAPVTAPVRPVVHPHVAVPVEPPPPKKPKKPVE